MLRSENLTITVPSVVYNDKLQNPFCNKNCKYCVSVMTGFTESSGLPYMERNVNKVKTYADRAQVTSVLLTGKGEPLLNLGAIETLASHFKEYSLELQTNGILLIDNPMLIQKLYNYGIDVIAISVDSDRDFNRFIDVVKDINRLGMTVRFTVNVSDKLKQYGTFGSVFEYAKENGVLQVLFRKLTIPRDSKSDEVAKWIEEHGDTGMYEEFVRDMNEVIEDRGEKIRILNTGEIVWSVDRRSLVSIDYCIQEESDGNDIRSLIFHEDGHLYTQWNDEASRLF